MPMKKSVLATSPDVCVASFDGWQRRRGQRLRHVESRLKPGGKYEMATLEIVERTPLQRSTVVELVSQAVALNASYGDPTRMNGAGGKSAA